jgi:hypothetical protein
MLLSVPGAQFITRFAGHCDKTGLAGVLELPMAAHSPDQLPTVLLDQPGDLADLHASSLPAFVCFRAHTAHREKHE